ncbi:hypothetical protein [Rhodanobacter sp. Root627]|uniref:hypothetical protein n=1 Tax=Rhodanobacter sp. Root627 TaxID=1736572 RepID=UPI0012E3AD38|nr:hypothetical protein [Rhodanobacter sp. Root627]
MMIQKALNSVKKRGVRRALSAGLADLVVFLGKILICWRDHHSKHRFSNRSSGRVNLVVVLAGYKPYLWPVTLARMAKYAPNDADFCVVSSGMHSTELEEMCIRQHWSYLSVTRNSPGVALNKVIELHPHADYIFKLDEDIVVGKNFFPLLRQGYDHAWKDSLLEPGFCAPVLNVNGISYRIFLRELGLEAIYQEEFGSLVTRCGDLPVHNDPITANWIWEKTLPFDKTAEVFSQHTNCYSLCGTRFSIGAILFRRSFIEEAGWFKSAWHSGVLGVDEDMICRDCVSFSRPMYIIESVLAGHFSFYPQEASMRTKLPEMSRLDPATFPAEHYASHETHE